MWYFEENAVEEFGAVVKTKLSFIFLKAFTVLLMGIVALGARQTPVVHTKLSPLNGVNSSVRVAPFPIYQLMAIILHQDVCLYPLPTQHVLATTLPAYFASARLPDMECPQTVHIFYPATST